MSLTRHEPMAITRETLGDGRGSTVSPARDMKWSPLEHLRWRAGLVECDAGVRICVTTDAERPGRFGWYAGDGSHSYTAGHSEGELEAFLNGVIDGARLARLVLA